MSMIVFLLVLSTLIIVHEWGHFFCARLLKIKVEKFSVGFGPKIFSRVSKGTEFLLSAIPLGGYVKMAGDDRHECKGSKDEFYARPVSHRAWVVVMGPLVNLVFAYFCFYVIFVAGFPMLGPKVGNVMEDYPAQAAGLLEGDRIGQVDGQPIETWDEMQDLIRRSTGEQISLTIVRGQETIMTAISPRDKEIKNLFGQEEMVRIIGIQPAEEVIYLSYGPVESLGKAGQEIWKVTSITFRALYHVFSGAMPAKDAIAGPIRIFDVIKSAAQMGLSSLIYIMGVISTSLALFNLFPIPVLDGGHLFFFAIEGIRKKPLPLKIEEGLTKVGFGMLICLMFFVLYNDVMHMGWVDRVTDFVGQIK